MTAGQREPRMLGVASCVVESCTQYQVEYESQHMEFSQIEKGMKDEKRRLIQNMVKDLRLDDAATRKLRRYTNKLSEAREKTKQDVALRAKASEANCAVSDRLQGKEVSTIDVEHFHTALQDFIDPLPPEQGVLAADPRAYLDPRILTLFAPRVQSLETWMKATCYVRGNNMIRRARIRAEASSASFTATAQAGSKFVLVG